MPVPEFSPVWHGLLTMLLGGAIGGLVVYIVVGGV